MNTQKTEVPEKFTDTYLISVKSPFTALPLNQHIALHSHYFWEITYPVKGDVVNIVNGVSVDCRALSKIVIIKPGDTHRMEKVADAADPPNQTHRNIYVFEDKMKKICSYLDKSLYGELCSKSVIELDTTLENLESLEMTLGLFGAYDISSAANAKLLDELHTTVIMQILGMYLKSQIRTTPNYPDWIVEFLNNLGNEQFLCRNVNDIIGDTHYSHGYVCREFKKHIGRTMIQCLNEKKVIYSTMLLADKSLSILDIAMRLNYCSQSAYINAFKEFYNITPSKYRKLMFS